MSLTIGTPAPDFTLVSHEGHRISLSDLKGARAMIVFVPYPFTEVCDTEMCNIRDTWDVYEETDTKVVVITCHAVSINTAWAAANGYRFPILADYWPHLRVVEWVPRPEGDFVEQPAPTSLTSHHVTILHAYGSLFYAGARTLQARLPEVGDAVEAVVVLRLRGRVGLGATAFKVLSDYADRLDAVEGRLYLSGVDPDVMTQFQSAGHLSPQGPIQMVEATPNIGESTLAALQDAEAWIIGHQALGEPTIEETPKPAAVGGWFRNLFRRG